MASTTMFLLAMGALVLLALMDDGFAWLSLREVHAPDPPRTTADDGSD